jgi:hypothetical protein
LGTIIEEAKERKKERKGTPKFYLFKKIIKKKKNPNLGFCVDGCFF